MIKNRFDAKLAAGSSIRSLLLLLLILLPLSAWAQGEGRDLLDSDGWDLTGANVKRSTPSDSEAPPGAKNLYHLEILQKGQAIYSMQFGQAVPVAVQEGQALRLRFWGRSRAKTTIQAVYEKTSEPYDKALNETVALTPAWKTYQFNFKTPAYPAGGAGLHFQLGNSLGDIDLADIHLEDLNAALLPTVATTAIGGDLLAGGTWAFNGATANDSEQTAVPAPEKPGGSAEAYRIIIKKVPAENYQIGFRQILREPVRRDQFLRLHFWARSPTRTPFRAVFEKNSDPFTKSLQLLVTPTTTWKEYAFPFKTPAYLAEGAAAVFHLGFKTGTIELAGIKLENYGVNPSEQPPSIHLDLYGGLPHDDTWRVAANQRIERYRKGNLIVRVLDGRGKPVSGAEVQVQQKRHAFRWGTAVSPILQEQSADGDKYRATVQKLFNYVVLENALKWNSVNDDDLPTADKMIDWCRAHNIRVRGHNLFWPGYAYMPPGIKELRGTAMQNATEVHVRKYVRQERGRVVVWDVVNEAVSNTEVLRDSGRDLLWKTFQWARQEDPTVDLCYNENTFADDAANTTDARRKKVLALVRELQQHRAPITEIGDQAHMGLPLTPGARLVAHWNEYATLGLPIEITEFDATIQDDTAHGQYQDEIMTAVFAQPQIRSFVMWGFWEGAHWLAESGGAMIRRDWSPRPAAKVYENLVLHKWWTNTRGKTGAMGTYQTRAFLGTHTVFVRRGDMTQTVLAEVTKNQNGITTVTVRL